MPRIDHEKALDLYERGAPDRYIAHRLGVTKLAVFNWRKRNDLPAHPRNKLHWLTPDMYRQSIRHFRLYNRAAEAIGVHPVTLRKWRKEQGLAA
ncbi:hypothetical protein [Sagittula sp. MA-2]|jgi:uncharacterized protein YjcR|uniref:hypothetical protein n=1 Tax=Sagittula sp. MA-2 TaxID=3048007 RepID=UPI0024C2DE32|nr:hypothetical protein [Sagittula sp. MA-2]WHZ35734.1 hypothetical protein QNI11_01720 [Sagittula sp. MA-2]